MMVQVAENIKGLVPRSHLSDIILKNPEKKYTEGMKVKCRVSTVFIKSPQKGNTKRFGCLNRLQCVSVDLGPQVLTVDADSKKMYLSRKKALIESSLPLFLSYADARPGRVSHGFIVCVKDFGCIVRFYNDVKGLVQLTELSTEPVNPKEIFYVGQVKKKTWRNKFVCFCVLEPDLKVVVFQVLKAKVLQCDPEKAKLLLSFKDVVQGEPEEDIKPQLDVEVGKV